MRTNTCRLEAGRKLEMLKVFVWSLVIGSPRMLQVQVILANAPVRGRDLECENFSDPRLCKGLRP